MAKKPFDYGKLYSTSPYKADYGDLENLILEHSDDPAVVIFSCQAIIKKNEVLKEAAEINLRETYNGKNERCEKIIEAEGKLRPLLRDMPKICAINAGKPEIIEKAKEQLIHAFKENLSVLKECDSNINNQNDTDVQTNLALAELGIKSFDA